MAKAMRAVAYFGLCANLQNKQNEDLGMILF